MKKIVLFLLVVACTPGTINDTLVRKSRGGGISRTYAISPAQATKVAARVFRQEGFGVIESHPDEHLIVSLWPEPYNRGFGDVFAVWCEPDGVGTRVTYAGPHDWNAAGEAELQAQFARLAAGENAAPGARLSCRSASECAQAACIAGYCQ